MLSHVRTIQEFAEAIIRLQADKANGVPGSKEQLKELSRTFKQLQDTYTSRVEDAVRTDAETASRFQHETLLLLRTMVDLQRETVKLLRWAVGASTPPRHWLC